MRLHRLQPELDERGRGERRHDDIDADGGHAHAQDDRDDSADRQETEHVATAHGEQLIRQAEGQSGEVEHADHKARCRRDDDQVDDADACRHDGGESVRERQLLALVADRHGEDQKRNCGKQSRIFRSHVQPEQTADQDDEGNGKLPAFPQHDEGLRQLASGRARNAEFCRLEIDLDEQRRVIQERGQDRRPDDAGVGDLQIFRDQKGGGAHDGRHQLPTRRAHRLDGGRDLRRKAVALHQGNRDHADAGDIGHRAARDHAEESRPKHGDFSRAAAIAAHQCGGNIREEITATGAREDLAHQNEGRDGDQRHLQRRAENRIGVDAQINREAAQRHRTRAENAGQQVSEIGVEAEHADHDNERQARRAARRLQHQQHDGRANQHAVPRAVDEFVDERGIARGNVGAGAETRSAEGDIDERDFALAPRPAGKMQEGQQQRETERGRHELFGVKRQRQPCRQVRHPADDDGNQQRLGEGLDEGDPGQLHVHHFVSSTPRSL